MDRVGTNVNWSLVACEAFEAVLSGTRLPEYQVPMVPLSADDGGEPMYIPAEAWAAEASGTLTRFVDLANQYAEYDPQFQTWYRELRAAAYSVIDSLDGLRIACTQFANLKPRETIGRTDLRGDHLRDQVVIHHPPQPASPRDGDPLGGCPGDLP